MSKTTIVRNAAWVLAWDAEMASHRYLRDTDVAFTDKTFAHVGAGYQGPVDEEIDGRGLMVMPGLIDIHSHPSSEPGNRGLLEELGSPRLGQSSLYEFMPVFRIAPEAADPANRVALGEALKSGVTTLVDLSGVRPGWADLYAESGMRAVLAPMYRSAAWVTHNGHSVEYTWDEKAGEKAFAIALDTIDAARCHDSGRLDGMLAPSQIDTCMEALLRDSLSEAKRRGIRVQIHAAQSVMEFETIVRRTGRTPIEWLDHVGLLGPDTIVAHGIFLNDHPWIHWPQADDFSLLSRSGAAVAHCPTVMIRRGIAMNTLGRYMAAGIPVGIGTDTFPHNMIDEMRHACYAGRVIGRSFTAVSTGQAFTAATVGGAQAIGRDDLGRIAPGAMADFSLVDVTHPYTRPLREPLRSLVYSASDRPVRHVFIDGRQVVRDGAVLTLDIDAALETLQGYQDETVATVSERDWAGRSIEEMSPMVFPVAG